MRLNANFILYFSVICSVLGQLKTRTEHRQGYGELDDELIERLLLSNFFSH